MWELLAGLVGEAFVTLAGPVAVARFARRNLGEIAAHGLLPTADSATSIRLSAELTHALSDAGLRQPDVIKVQKFVASESGRYFARLTAINVAAATTPLNEIEATLTGQCAALMKLELRQEFEWIDQAAASLTIAYHQLCDAHYGEVKKRDAALASEIRATARDQANLPYRFRARTNADRVHAIEGLAPIMPDDLVEMIDNYVDLIAEATATLTISTIQRDITLPLTATRVTPEIQSQELSNDSDHRITDLTMHRRQGRPASNEAEEPSDPLLAILETRSRVVLLGDPGGGKSTAVQAAVQALAKVAQAGTRAAIPFRVVLRHYARAIELDQQIGIVRYIHESISDAYSSHFDISAIRYLFHTGRAVIFFDGLDEILEFEKRGQLIDRIHRFVSSFPGVAVVVTAREVGYDQQPLASTFHEARIQPFDDGKVQEYVQNILGQLLVSDVAFDVSLLPDRFMVESAGIRPIRSNPLMLGVLCSLYAVNRTIPRNRLELYAKCAQMLFSEWDARRHLAINVLDPDITEAATRELALEIFRSGQEEFSESWLRNRLEDLHLQLPGSSRFRAKQFSEETLKLWRGRKWLLVFIGHNDGEDYYKFTHRTFLEFFAAEQQVYVTESAATLWEELAPYVMRENATLFCLLAAEFLSQRQQSGGEIFLRAALQAHRERHLDGDMLAASNIASFCFQCLPFVRASAATRLEITSSYVDFFAILVPWLSVNDRRRESEPPSLSYVNVFEHYHLRSEENRTDLEEYFFEGSASEAPEVDDEDSEFDDSASRSDLSLLASRQTVEGVAANFLHLGSLRDFERDSHLEQIFLASRSLLKREPQLGLRWAATLKQLAYLPSWASHVMRGQFHLQATRLWTLAIRYRWSSDRFAQPDYWLALALARANGNIAPGVLNLLELDDLFVGGWPLSIEDGNASGCIAHTISEVLGTGGANALTSRFSKLLSEYRPAPGVPLAGDQQDFERKLVTFDHSTSYNLGDLDHEDWLLLVYCLAGLGSLGDTEFVRSYLARVSAAEHRVMLDQLCVVYAYPALAGLGDLTAVANDLCAKNRRLFQRALIGILGPEAEWK